MKSLDAVARLLARKLQTSVAIADCYDIRLDPSEVFAIVPIRVVGEEVIQAVAYGDMRRQPRVVVEHHALSRRTAFLEPFGEALNEYLNRMAESEFPRIYISHPAAMELLTILAARYEQRRQQPNPKHLAQEPSDIIRRLGYQCRLLNELYHMPGQQLVVVMTDAIRRHFVSGQIPPKDGHLGALAIWLDPPAGRLTQEAADRFALDQPAAAMLHRNDDDAVESKLRRLKRSSTAVEREQLQREIEDLQRRAVVTEWDILLRAHAAFWGRHLKPIQHPLFDTLTEANLDWLRYRIATPIARARRVIPMSKLYDQYEYQQGLHGAVLIEEDRIRFNQARADGRAFIGTITAIRKTPIRVEPKNHEIDIKVEIQPKIRLRPGREICAIGQNVGGVVRAFRQTNAGYDVTIRVLKGIRSLRMPGGRFRWADSLPADYPRIKRGYHERVRRLLAI